MFDTRGFKATLSNTKSPTRLEALNTVVRVSYGQCRLRSFVVAGVLGYLGRGIVIGKRYRSAAFTAYFFSSACVHVL